MFCGWYARIGCKTLADHDHPFRRHALIRSRPQKVRSARERLRAEVDVHGLPGLSRSLVKHVDLASKDVVQRDMQLAGFTGRDCSPWVCRGRGVNHDLYRFFWKNRYGDGFGQRLCPIHVDLAETKAVQTGLKV